MSKLSVISLTFYLSLLLIKLCNSIPYCTSSADQECSICEDNLDCTADACYEGNCVNQNLCDDENQCTDNICTDNGCSYPYKCGDANCGCHPIDACNTATCTAADGCGNDPIDVPTVCGDANACTIDTCDPVTGCVNTPIVASEICDDTVACTDDTCDPLSGCVNTPNDNNCHPSSACVTASCNGESGCQETAIDCSIGIPSCVDYDCDPVMGCQFTPNPSLCTGGPGGECQKAECDLHSGCMYTADDSLCTDPDLCENGSCSPSPAGFVCSFTRTDCDDGLTCTDDSCNPTTGNCVNTESNVVCDALETGDCINLVCDSLNAPPGSLTGCNAVPTPSRCPMPITCFDYTCQSDGSCTGVPNNGKCTNGAPCETNICDPSSGDADGEGCVYTPTPSLCPGSGRECDAATCDKTSLTADANGCIYTPTPSECDDNIDCTDNICNPTTGICEYPKNNDNCLLGSECTVNKCDPHNHFAKHDGCIYIPKSSLCPKSTKKCYYYKCTKDGCIEKKSYFCGIKGEKGGGSGEDRHHFKLNENNNNNNEFNNKKGLFIAIISSVLLVIISLILLFIYYKINKKKQIKKEMEMGDIQVNNKTNHETNIDAKPETTTNAATIETEGDDI